MSPLPCSPVSNSTASEQSALPSEDDSDDSLTTPRPGPSDPAQRTHANLSRPAVPTQAFSQGLDRPHEQDPDNQPLDSGKSSQKFKAPRQIRNPFANVNRPLERVADTSDESATGVPQLRERPRNISFVPRTATSRSEGSLTEPIPAMSASRDPPGGSPRQKSHLQSDVESSADETTGIVRSTYKRSTSATNYGTVVEDAEPSSARNQGYDAAAEEPEGTVRRRTSLAKSRTARAAVSARENARDDDDGGVTSGRRQWVRSFIDQYGSIELENKGSVARDHLALERTFLAWLRTSLSFASIGIAITQLFRLNTSIARSSDNQTSIFTTHPISRHDTARLRSIGKPLGATFLGISILILLLGFHRFFESQHYVIRGKFPASRGSIIVVSLVAAILIIASLIVVVCIAPTAFET